MESGIFSFILRYSKKDQIILLAVIAVSFPFLYMSMDLPKMIINKAIGGSAFPQDIFGFELEQIPYLMTLCVMFLSLVFINGMFKLWVNIYRGALGERMLRRIRYQLIERVMRFPLPHFRNVSQGEVVSIVTTETEPLGGFVGEALSLPAFQGGTLLTILAFMFVQDWALGLAAIALYPVQMYAIPKLQMKINRLGKERVAAVRKLSERVGEMVTGVHEIHANDTSQYELADFSNRLGRIFNIRYTIYRKKFFVKFLNNFLAQLTPFFFFSIGGYLVIQGDLSFGALVATLGAYKDLSAPWKELLAYYQKMEDARIKYQQMAERFEPEGMLDENLQVAAEVGDINLSGAVVINNLSLEEEEGVKVVSGASFSFDTSDHVAIVGGPGTGKNQIAKLLARQLFPTGGTITIDGKNMSELPESVVGRQISYIDPEVFIASGTIIDNLMYVLKNHPRENDPAAEKSDLDFDAARNEAALSGNSLLNVDTNWVDFSGLGLDSSDALLEEAFSALRAVGMENEIFDLGLRRIIDPDKNPELASGVLKIRQAFGKSLEDPKIADLVQVFDKETYNTNASVAENILFGTPKGKSLQIDNLGENPYVNEVLEKVGLTTAFLEMGLSVATLTVDLFKDLPPGHEFFERFSFIEEDELADFQRISTLATNKGLDKLNSEDSKRLTDLPFKLIVAKHRLDLIDDAMAEKLLEARNAFAAGLPENMTDDIEFFEAENYNSASSILDNALFGKISTDRGDSQTQVIEIITNTISELGLRNAVLEAGLDYDVGVGGKRLSPVQRQKLGIARGLLKKSKLMIVNDATALLSKPDQTAVMEAVKSATKNSGLVWVTEDADSVHEFGTVLTASAGRISAQKDSDSSAAAEATPPSETDKSSELGDEVELFAGIPFFAGLDRSTLKLLAFTSERQILKPGEILFNQGDEGDAAYVISNGDCDILVSSGGGQVKVADSKSGDVIGELALLCDAPRTATIQAVGEVIVLRVSKDVFLKLIRDNPDISANLTRIIAGRLEKMMRDLTGTVTPPLYRDVAGFPNTSLFLDRIETAVNIDAREKGSSNVVILDFGDVIESLMEPGSDVEKPLLQEITNRLKDVIRKSDSLARISNASYGIVARTSVDNGGTDAVIKHLRERLEEPIDVGDTQISLTDKISFDSYSLSEDASEDSIKKIKKRLNIK